MTAAPPADRAVAPQRHRFAINRTVLVWAGTVVCAATLLAGFANKHRCVGPTFDAAGRSGPNWRIRINADVCFSAIQQLWLGRDINLHVFPYVHGGLTAAGQLTGGTVEYPVLTGLVMWLGALGAHNDGQYLAHSALLLAPFGLVTAVLLFALAGRRGWWYALSPALVMYAFLSWDLLPVACATAGCAAILAGPSRWSRRRRAVLAAVAFGIGGAAKFYPLMFTAPVIVWMLYPDPPVPVTGQPQADGQMPPQPDIRGASMVVAAAVGTWAVINAPFAVAGFSGWWAAFQFQWSRPIDLTTNSIWFWAVRPATNPVDTDVQHWLSVCSTAATAAGMLAVLVAGLVLTRRGRHRQYPWLQVCAAMLCAYLLLNKVHSPQYTLWLLPFMVLLRIRTGWIVAYTLVDVAIGIGFFRWQYLIISHQPSGIFDSWAAQAVVIGVWGRAALLIGMGIAFLTAPTARDGPTDVPGNVRRDGHRLDVVTHSVTDVSPTGMVGESVGSASSRPEPVERAAGRPGDRHDPGVQRSPVKSVRHNEKRAIGSVSPGILYLAW